MNDQELTILYGDDNILALNKPAGLVVHSDGRTKEKTLVDMISEKYPEIKDVGEPLTLASGKVVHKGGIVHRLDRETSGVILVAKNQEAFTHLKSQFQERKVEKIYHAVVAGEVKHGEGVIDRPIAKSRSDFRKWSATRGSRGVEREAVTAYRVLARKEGFSYVAAMPKTGRTHQIRVHFSAINYPIIGDKLYAPRYAEALGFTRLGLHARGITFKNLEGKKISLEAPFPRDFNEIRHFFGLER